MDNNETQTELETNEARAGRTTPYMKYILGISIVLAVILMLGTFFFFSAS